MKKTFAILFLLCYGKLFSQINTIQYSSVGSGTVVIVDTKQNVLLIQDAGALALTISLPANPFNGQTVSITTTAAIVALTMSTPVGVIVGSTTTLLSNQAIKYTYYQPINKWIKII